MNLEEYNQVKDFSYDDYCDYLKKKYGEVPEPYYVPKKPKGRKKAHLDESGVDVKANSPQDVEYIKNRRIGRGNEGLMIHHIKEDREWLLSSSPYPIEYQQPENLVYCNYLEHLLLHIMIEEQSKFPGKAGPGVDLFLIPEIEGIYNNSPNLYTWQLRARDVIKDDKEIFEILKKRHQEAKGDILNLID